MRCQGHHEFSEFLSCINAGDNGTIDCIRKLYDAEGRAVYWDSIYKFIADQIEKSSELQEACLVVHYDDLCYNSASTIDKILKHTGLSGNGFTEIKKEYSVKFKKPTYYKTDFSGEEIEIIKKITVRTAARFGY